MREQEFGGMYCSVLTVKYEHELKAESWPHFPSPCSPDPPWLCSAAHLWFLLGFSESWGVKLQSFHLWRRAGKARGR